MATTDQEGFIVKAIVIGLTNGLPLITLKIDQSLNEHSLTTMLSVIKNLASDILGSANEMQIKSKENFLYCYRKTYHNGDLDLYICSLLSSKVDNEVLNEQSEKALTGFIEYYGLQTLLDWDGNIKMFDSYYNMLKAQLDEFLDNYVSMINENENIDDSNSSSSNTKENNKRKILSKKEKSEKRIRRIFQKIFGTK